MKIPLFIDPVYSKSKYTGALNFQNCFFLPQPSDGASPTAIEEEEEDEEISARDSLMVLSQVTFLLFFLFINARDSFMASVLKSTLCYDFYLVIVLGL